MINSDSIDDVLETFIVEADLAGRFLEQNFLGLNLKFWRLQLNYDRDSLIMVAKILEDILAGKTSFPLEEVARRVMQYVGETIQRHVRAFWEREGGRFLLRVHYKDGKTVSVDLAHVCALTIMAIRIGDPAALKLLQTEFDRALQAGTEPVC